MSRPVSCPVDPAQRDELLAICARTFQQPEPDGRLPRQFHRKTHACLRATLTVDPPEDPGVRHGLFARPGRYDALVRFSNSFFAEDNHPDLRGLAVKVMGVEGPVCDGAPPGQQDFVLMNAETGPARDASEALALFRALDGIRRATPFAVAAPRYMFPSLLPWRARWRYFAFLSASSLRHLRGRDLAQLSYGSVTPYRLGDGAMKFALVPDIDARNRRPAKGKDLAGKLQATLDKGPIRFDFRLQPRVLESDPMEDVRRAWHSPSVTVGRLEIPPQDVAATVALGDRLTFAPWNCLSAHEPLGSINALRRAAYAASAANRGAEATAPPGCPG
ncbi:hypothetical protein T8K17_14485 [Thalassobaculum sp. OXR-137]|uniref:hypothetical protein n=1 Tax=Thalassobaculum sp. OXR-137 TaxID=3100173 RepID=UPI002AC94952|nr:hypothetical protein [Thalassobaculum sp. OXR-137]WPZ32448.1 hypothetical protein T8K17_14485 [Thalassobaculum sp. OXR-137]